jgi:hypothetical protein
LDLAIKSTLPKVLLLVDERNVSSWNQAVAAIGNNSFKVIGIQYGQPNDSNSGIMYNHQELQEVIQDPHYNVIKSKKALKKFEPNSMMAYIEQKTDQNNVKIFDISGRWMEICKYHLDTEDFSRFVDNWYGEKKIKLDPYSEMYCSTALRPDGHTISMLNPIESTDLVLITNFIQLAKNNVSVF